MDLRATERSEEVEMERCFQALGLTEAPASEEEWKAAYEAALEKAGSRTESDLLARRLAEENYQQGLRILRNEKAAP